MTSPTSYAWIDNALCYDPRMLEVDHALYFEVAGLYVAMMALCSERGTDGTLPIKAITGPSGIAPARDDLLSEMIRVRLVERRDDSVFIPDCLESQRLGEEQFQEADAE